MLVIRAYVFQSPKVLKFFHFASKPGVSCLYHFCCFSLTSSSSSSSSSGYALKLNRLSVLERCRCEKKEKLALNWGRPNTACS